MKRILLSLALFSDLSPATTHAVIAQHLSCEASILADNGTTLIYQITGQIDLDSAGQQMRPTEADSGLSLTVKRRDSTGQVQTLLNRTPMKNFEMIAPDADYSSLPFTGIFRGLPNDGTGLYSVTTSRYGLYASLRSFQGIPPHVQIVHYLSAERFVRSTPGICRIVPSFTPMSVLP